MPVLHVIDIQNDSTSPDCCIMYTATAATTPDAQAAACRHMHEPPGIPIITLRTFMQETGALPC